jgi:hypothetical protein
MGAESLVGLSKEPLGGGGIVNGSIIITFGGAQRGMRLLL